MRSISIYIQNCSNYFFSMWYLHSVLEHCTSVIYACALPVPLISSFSAILKSLCPLHGYILVRDTARHRFIAIWRWCSRRANYASLRTDNRFDIFQRERLMSKLTRRSETPGNTVQKMKQTLLEKPCVFDKSTGNLRVFYGSLHFFFFLL